MTTDTQVFEKWGSTQLNKFALIERFWPKASDADKVALRILVGTPLYHFEREANERALLQSSGQGGRESERSGMSASEPVDVSGAMRSGSAAANPVHPQCSKCGKEFQPKFPGAKVCLSCYRKEHPRR